MHKYILLLLLLSFFAGNAQSLPTASEYQALMDLYSSTNGAGWTNKTGWSTAKPDSVQSVQGWYGVTVDAQGHVTALNLGQNNLTGTLPGTIGNLVFAKQLVMYTNKLSGNIPDGIGGLASIEYIHLGGNQLIGSIPASIENLSHLQILSLADNSLSGTLPEHIGNLNALTSLFLNHNGLSGILPSSIGQLIHLTSLNLAENQFSGLPSQISGLVSVKEFLMYSNKLSGNIPDDIGGLVNAEYIHLGNNQLTGSLPITIGDLKHIQTLSLAGNSLSGPIPSSIEKLTSLISLLLNGNQFSGPIPSAIGKLSNLKTLDLHSNQFTSIPAEIGGLTSLENLYLNINSLNSGIPIEIGDLVNLKVAYFNQNQLNGNIPASIGKLVKLQILELRSNLISGPVPSSISSMTSLAGLYLDGNKLSGDIPATIGQVSSLNAIGIGTNKFTFSNFLDLKQAKPQLVFSPQDLVDEEKNIQGVLNSSLTLTTSIDRNTTPSSIYRWFKIVNGTVTALNTASNDGHTVTIPTIAQVDQGTKYYYTITNSAAPGLILTSRQQTLQVVTCSTPVLDFQFQEANGTHSFTPALTQAQGCTVTYTWDFGDGNTSQEQVATHEYLNTGSYTVKLTASYQCGSCAASTITKEYQVEITNSGICASVYCDGNGGVGIGTRKTSGFRLSVNGKIRASDIVKVYPQTQWPDFVFESNYQLSPLAEVEKFIKANGHLPGIPSAKEAENEGVALGDMNAKLLQKIEELTLYVIDLQKEIEILKSKK